MMPITEIDQIVKYMKINQYSKSECLFFTDKKRDKKVEAKFTYVSPRRVQIEFPTEPEKWEGLIHFYSFSDFMEARVKIQRDIVDRKLYFHLPEKLSLSDIRKHSRLTFDSIGNKIISVYSERLKITFKALLQDISAGGIGIYPIDLESELKAGDLLITTLSFLNRQIKTLLKYDPFFQKPLAANFMIWMNQPFWKLIRK